jgi:low affinity Fe/Cu permease
MKNYLKVLSNYMDNQLEGMSGPITRLMIYISIASLTALMKDFSQYQTFDQITPVTWVLIIINFLLQGLVAWRAYIDGSYQEAIKDIQEGKKLAQQQEKLING